jgi:hypothetical protein
MGRQQTLQERGNKSSLCENPAAHITKRDETNVSNLVERGMKDYLSREVKSEAEACLGYQKVFTGLILIL